jgi:hypothetical protein
MAANDLALERAARRAYELGRLRSALRHVPFVLAAAAAAIAAGRPPALTFTLAGALLLLMLGLSSRGGAVGRAVAPGFVAGSAALAMPLLMATVGHACFGPACMRLGLPACIAGGAVAGVVIAKSAARQPGLAFIAAAIGIAALTGALGCTTAGAAGVVGMLAGALVAAAPVLVAARR